MTTKYNKYIEIYRNYKKFEENEKLVWSRFYLEDYAFDKRKYFVLALIENCVKNEFVIEVQFWEENQKMVEFFKQLKNSYSIIKEYNNKQSPGIIVIDDYCLDIHFFEQLLQSHYNYELASEPALSVKILLFINQKDHLRVFDFYDDRGFTISYYYYD
jgi:hypothetical protein